MPRRTVQASTPQTPVDESLVGRVRAALGAVPKVTERRMFGSVGFMVRGNLCVAARPENIMCRIDRSTHDKAIEHEGVRTVVMRGREYRGYVQVDASVLATDAALHHWIGQALDFNRTLPESVK